MKKFLITEKQLKFIVDNFDMLNEQENIQTRSLPTIDFNSTFLDNMVKIYQNDNLTNALSELDQNINKYRKKNKKLKSISVIINAGSSTPTATNSLPSGVNHPDHEYNGLLSINVCEKGKKDKCWLPSSRRDERVNITNGNIYLANQRANNLKVYLEKYLRDKYGVAQITINIKDVKESTTKFASAVIDGIVWENEIPTEQFRWDYFKINRMYPNGPLNFTYQDILQNASSWTTTGINTWLGKIVEFGLVKNSKQTKDKFGNVIFTYPADLKNYDVIGNEINKYFNNEKTLLKSGKENELYGKKLYDILNTQIPSLQGKLLENPPFQVDRVIKR